MKENKEIWICVNEGYASHGKGNSADEAYNDLREVILNEYTGYPEVADCTFYKAQEVKMKMKIVEDKEGE